MTQVVCTEAREPIHTARGPSEEWAMNGSEEKTCIENGDFQRR